MWEIGVYAYIPVYIYHLSNFAINCGARERKLPIIPNASHPLRISTEGPWLMASFCLNFFSVNRRSEEAQIWENDLGVDNEKAFRGPPANFCKSEEEDDHFFLFPPTDGFCPSVPRLISHSPSFPANGKEKRREAFAKNISSPEPISGKKWGRPCHGKKPLFRPKNKRDCVA